MLELIGKRYTSNRKRITNYSKKLYLSSNRSKFDPHNNFFINMLIYNTMVDRDRTDDFFRNFFSFLLRLFIFLFYLFIFSELYSIQFKV
jgi:hypothetical protein